MYAITEEGKKYLREGLPEQKLADIVKMKPTAIKEVKNKIDNFSIALAWAKKKGLVKIENGVLYFLKDDVQIELEYLRKFPNISEDAKKLLLKRNLIKEEKDDIFKRAQKYKGKVVDDLNEEIIKTGVWKDVSFRKYDVSLLGKRIYAGRRHIVSLYIEKARRIFLDMGFKEVDGNLVESSFWNFDALFQPQDHPAREMADTFFMKKPSEAKLPPEFVRKIKDVHEHGGYGSVGWRYQWSEDIAKKVIMRTHTTTVSARYLPKSNPPEKVFCIGKVFRNETIDYKHLPEFIQIEGIVISENVNFRNLLGYLKEFYKRMGFKKVRFRPGYFPYTEISVEPEVYFEERGDWIELGGAGIFRPEVTRPLGVDVPVLAWGLGLERLIMLKTNMDDIRYFYYKNDLNMLREMPIWL